MSTPRRIEPLLAAGAPPPARRSPVFAPWDGRVVAEVAELSAEGVEHALAAAFRAREAGRALPTSARKAACEALAAGLERRADELLQALVDEAGKPRALARVEVARGVGTLRLSAAELLRSDGIAPALDLDDGARGFTGQWRRVPAGVVAAISPFNFPLNLGLHKLAPALAVGAPVLWKPPREAPGAAGIVGEVLRGLGLPDGLVQIVPCANEEAERLALDERVAVLSFTGSAAVGWRLKRLSPRARVTLELGGNAAAIVCEDADLARAARSCARSAFGYAGQVCISLQRLLVHEAVFDAFLALLRAELRALGVGDPARDDVLVGPLVSERAADRIEAWYAAARAAGCAVEGGAREGRLLRPALLHGAGPGLQVWDDELFGPGLCLQRFTEFEQALASVDASPWGLQAALFTQRLDRIRRASERLEVGALIVGEAPSFRHDGMPYGGVKGSGLGREGPRWAMEELTELRGLVLARP